jgi:hypothetical protein
MAKVQFNDVVPPEKRSIRNVPIPNGGKRKPPVVIKPETGPTVSASPDFSNPKPDLSAPSSVSAKISEMVEQKNRGAYEYYYPKNKNEPNSVEPHVGSGKSGKKRWVFGAIALFAVASFVFFMMTVFSSATVLITPKSQEVAVDLGFTGTVEAQDGTVRYEVVKLSKSKTVSVPATGEEAVELKARGKIVVYNNFSSDPQRLIIRTRFESPSGLIYRIPESITVPGKSVKDGVETPGSIEVEVFADEAGEKYNIDKSDFTIPGFKTDPVRYKGFYARSSTKMEGGFVGNMKTILPAEKDAALVNVDSDLTSFLESELKTKVPQGLSLLPNSIVYDFTDLPQKEDSSAVAVGREATAYALMINRQDLSDKIVNEYIKNFPGWENIKASIADFSLLSMDTKLNKAEIGQKIELKVKGKATILAEIDTNIIGQKLVGAPKGDAAKLIDEFTGISSVRAIIRPIWKQSFPSNPLKISVQIATAK